MSLIIQKLTRKIDENYEVLHYSKFMNEEELKEFIQVYEKLLIKYTQQSVYKFEIHKEYDSNAKQISECILTEQSTDYDSNDWHRFNYGHYILFCGEENFGEVKVFDKNQFKELNLKEDK